MGAADRFPLKTPPSVKSEASSMSSRGSERGNTNNKKYGEALTGFHIS